ncbi:MAG: DUF2063 domain-containing protein [Betaproteobacteria bacterium]|nr:DUF2063 domain-containing protein [Betaproteobacteria bacterium]
MPSLLEAQERFATAVLSAENPDAPDLIEHGALSPATRLEIYRNNVLSNYRNALRDTFPVIVKLVGDESFNACARRYTRETVSRSGDLHDYGESFGDFLRHFEPAQSLAYLGDVADMEWCMHRVFHAADVEPLDLGDFAAIEQARWPALMLTPSPALRLMASRFPIVRIWRLCMQSEREEGVSVDLDNGGEDVVILRRGFEVTLEALPSANFQALSVLVEGKPLGNAVDVALEVDPDFDLPAFLHSHVLSGAFVGVQA